MDSDPLWPSLAASVASIAVGGASVHFRLFIESDGEFRKRVSLRRKELTERLAAKHAALLQYVRLIVNTPDTVLRGDGREEPDMVGDLARETFTVSTILYRLEILRTVVRTAYFLLYLTIGAGLLGVLLSWIWSDARPYLLWLALALIALQMILIHGVMRASASLEVYEDVS